MLDFSVTFVITIFNIVLLTFILKAILFKPINKFMAGRAKQIRDNIEEAKTDREKARELLERHREKLETAGVEADEIITSAREKAETRADKIVADGKTAAEALIAEARLQIELERKKTLARFGMEATALVLAASSRLAQREFTDEDNRRYADMLLSELGAASVTMSRAQPNPRKGKG